MGSSKKEKKIKISKKEIKKEIKKKIEGDIKDKITQKRYKQILEKVCDNELVIPTIKDLKLILKKEGFVGMHNTAIAGLNNSLMAKGYLIRIKHNRLKISETVLS